ncbi:MAG: hypothetical protein WC329_01710 [Candidatus Omnitrophota bacterium]|jgi:hypothetical protein
MRYTTSKHKEMQQIIKLYKSETGELQVDMRKIAEYAVKKGWPLPIPTDPLDRLASDFTQAAREEVETDKVTGHPYRVNHAYKVGQAMFWINIDEAPREPMQKSLIARREQMVDDGLQLTYDADHWNRIHSYEEPIQIPLDFTDDIQWRKMGLD